MTWLTDSHRETQTLPTLWDLCERAQFLRDNVEPAALACDFITHPHACSLWEELEAEEPRVRQRLRDAAEAVSRQLREHALDAAGFRACWEPLGFSPTPARAGTSADDFLDGLFHLERLTVGEPRPAFGTVNMSSRAKQVSDFLNATQPNANDVVFDLGSGSGKLALTVAASTEAQVRGVELGEAYVATATDLAGRLGLTNVRFLHTNVTTCDLSEGSIFYLYYPFHGPVAENVAARLGQLGREKSITLYVSGPKNEFGEHFLAQVEAGALELRERRGDFSEVMLLQSA